MWMYIQFSFKQPVVNEDCRKCMKHPHIRWSVTVLPHHATASLQFDVIVQTLGIRRCATTRVVGAVLHRLVLVDA